MIEFLTDEIVDNIIPEVVNNPIELTESQINSGTFFKLFELYDFKKLTEIIPLFVRFNPAKYKKGVIVKVLTSERFINKEGKTFWMFFERRLCIDNCYYLRAGFKNQQTPFIDKNNRYYYMEDTPNLPRNIIVGKVLGETSKTLHNTKFMKKLIKNYWWLKFKK